MRPSRRSIAVTAAGAVLVALVLGWALAGHREEFATALRSAPVWLLAVAAALQVVALVSRSEAWHASVAAAGGTVSRRRLFGASGLGNLASVVNSQLATAARITVLRRTAPGDTPCVSALIAAEVPIVTVEVALAALASFTLVGPLGLPGGCRSSASWRPVPRSRRSGGCPGAGSANAGRGWRSCGACAGASTSCSSSSSPCPPRSCGTC